MKILIYTDNVSNNHILYYALGRLLGKQNVFFVNANEIRQGALTSGVDMLVMPGGASRYKSAKLNGEGNHRIKQYVAQGGRYLGICAGSYLACKTTWWAKGQPCEIVTDNELALFAATAVGPIETFGVGDNYNATAPRIVMLDVEGTSVPSLYMGGCQFDPDPASDPLYEVMATFSDLPDSPPAIVTGEYDKGRWLLSSTHPEYDREAIELLNFDVVGNEYQDFCRLQPDDHLTLELLDRLLHKLMR